MTGEGDVGGPLDVAALEVLARRAATHPLVAEWEFQPDALSPRRLELHIEAGQYPAPVETTRLDVRWFDGGDYTVHYLETRNGEIWQYRWDRHPKPDAPLEHFHPPPDADSVERSPIVADHYLDVLFAVLDRVERRVTTLHEG